MYYINEELRDKIADRLFDAVCFGLEKLEPEARISFGKCQNYITGDENVLDIVEHYERLAKAVEEIAGDRNQQTSLD